MNPESSFFGNHSTDELMQSENLPDNSHLLCNLCITGLDESITAEDLHLLYGKFGLIKSAKVAIDPATLKSKCYGYVWFVEEDSCKRAMIEANSYLTSVRAPYLCKLFEMGGLRHARVLVESEGFQTVTAINFPEDYTEQELRSIFADTPILSCVMIPQKML